MTIHINVIDLQIISFSQEWKLDTLCDLYETLTITQAVIFCNTRRKVDWLTEKMLSRDFTVSAMVCSTCICQGQNCCISKLIMYAFAIWVIQETNVCLLFTVKNVCWLVAHCRTKKIFGGGKLVGQSVNIKLK